MIGTPTTDILSIEQVAEVLKCDKETAAERLNKGELPGLKFGRPWIVPAAAFYQRLNELALEQSERRRGAGGQRSGQQGDPEHTEQPAKRKRGRPRFDPSRLV